MENATSLDLEIAIRQENLKEAKELLNKNPELQAYINEKLYSLVVDHQYKHSTMASADPGKLKNIQTLLSIGADPGYRKDPFSVTMLEKSTYTNDVPLIRLLLEKGADPCTGSFDEPDEPETFEMTSKNIDEKSFEIRHWPIQIAYGKYIRDFVNHKEMFNLLSEAAVTESSLETRFESVFKILVDEISKAKEEAKKNNKRLMILIGEGHEDTNSFAIELMAYLIASRLYDINTVLVEKDQAMLDHFEKTGTIPTRENAWLTSISFLPILKQNNAHIVPIDIDRAAVKGKGLTSEMGVFSRDGTMAYVANQSRCDVMCVIGQGHMYGMLTKTDLESNFHVLPISTTKSSPEINEAKKNPPKITLQEFDKLSHEKKSADFNTTFPEKVLNLNVFSREKYKQLFSPDQASILIKKLFEQLQPDVVNKNKI